MTKGVKKETEVKKIEKVEIEEKNADINNKNEKKEKNNKKAQENKTMSVKIIAIVISAIIAIFVIDKVFFSEKGKIIIEAKSSQEKVVDTNELRTVTYTYNGIATKCKKECKSKKDHLYYVSYKGTVTAGIDFSNLDYKVEEKKLIITVPEPVISGNNVEVGKFEYIFVDEKYNVPSELNKAFELCKKDLENRSEKDELILKTAKDNAIFVIKQFYEPWLRKNYPKYELVVK